MHERGDATSGPSRAGGRVSSEGRGFRSGMKKLSFVLGICLLGWFASPAPAEPIGGASSPDAVAGSSYVIGVAGDIACNADPYSDSKPDNCQYDDTADLLAGVTTILALGDNQYPTGGYNAYTTYYGPTWGQYIANTDPVPGNHEYAQNPSSTPRGYFRYFGDWVKGPDGLGYYSFDVPQGCTPGQEVCWHLIALSSELCFADGGCGPPPDPSQPGLRNRMHDWLKQDLSAHPQADYACTLAYWHHPLFSFSSASGASPAMRPLWRLLYRAQADIVVNGHSHNYQRWRPQAPGGALDTNRGIREFVVGTGGASKYAFRSGDPPPNLVVAQDDTFGILRITLGRTGYSWEWVTAAGQPQSFTDTKATSVKCR